MSQTPARDAAMQNLSMDREDFSYRTLSPARDAALLPRRFTLPAEVGIERLARPLALAAFGAGILAFGLFSHGHHAPLTTTDETLRAACLGIGALLGIAALSIYCLVDNYYVLDVEQQQILLHKGTRFSSSEIPMVDFASVSAVGLDAAVRKGGRGTFLGWCYTPVFILKGRESIRLTPTNANRDCNRLAEMNRKTKFWAELFGCDWFECPAGEPNEVQKQWEFQRMIRHETKANHAPI